MSIVKMSNSQIQYRHTSPLLQEVSQLLLEKHSGEDQKIFVSLLDTPEGDVLRYQNNYLGTLLHVLDSGGDTFTIRTWLSVRGIDISENALLLYVIEAEGVSPQEEVVPRAPSELQGFTSDKDMELIYNYAENKAVGRNTFEITHRVPGLTFQQAYYDGLIDIILVGKWNGFEVDFSINATAAKLSLSRDDSYLNFGWRESIRTVYSVKHSHDPSFHLDHKSVDSVFLMLFQNLGKPKYTHIVNSSEYGRHELEADSIEELVQQMEKAYTIQFESKLIALKDKIKQIENEKPSFTVLPA